MVHNGKTKNGIELGEGVESAGFGDVSDFKLMLWMELFGNSD